MRGTHTETAVAAGEAGATRGQWAAGQGGRTLTGRRWLLQVRVGPLTSGRAGQGVGSECVWGMGRGRILPCPPVPAGDLPDPGTAALPLLGRPSGALARWKQRRWPRRQRKAALN